MLKRPKPKTLTAEEIQAISTASAEQTGKAKILRSYDPNFPVFEIPVNEKVLVYVPNHTIQMPDGSLQLKMDKFAGHSCVSGRQYLTIRCSQGIENETLGLDGTCPLCDAVSECWSLVNKEFGSILKSKGESPDDSDLRTDARFKADWEECKKHIAVGGGVVQVTFPIVVIDCVEKDGKKTVVPKKDSEGRIHGTVMWYTVAEKTYKEKWEKALDTVESEDGVPPTSPAGLWAILNYTYESDDGKHNKRDSARKLTVGYKQMAGYAPWEAEFDRISEEWTPAKAMEVVVSNVIRDMDEMKEACTEIMKSTRDKLAVFELGASAGVPKSVGSLASAEATLESFGAVEALPNSATAPTGVPTGVPQAGISTDANIG